MRSHLKILQNFSSNSEAFASELLENVEDIFVGNDMLNIFNLLITHYCVTSSERVISQDIIYCRKT